jgi:hypothetical protein
LFKPQFGLPLLLLVAVAGGRPKVLLGALPVAAGLYLCGALVSGADWPLAWWDSTLRFGTMTRVTEADNTIGIVGLLAGLFGIESLSARIAGWLITLVSALALALCWHRRPTSLDTLFAVTACIIVMLPPHAVFYDAGLAGLALLLMYDRAGGRSSWPFALLALASWSALFNDHLGFSPASVFLLAAVVLVVRLERRLEAPRETDVSRIP